MIQAVIRYNSSHGMLPVINWTVEVDGNVVHRAYQQDAAVRWAKENGYSIVS